MVSSEEKDQSVISFLKKRFKNTSISLIYKLFRTKKIQVNQQNCRYYHYRLKEKDQIIIKDKWLRTSTEQKTLPLLPPLDLNITYEDKNILLALKEPNQEIYKRNDPSCLDNQVQYYLYQQNPEKYQQQMQNFFVPVALHRLDKLTKGLVIYPKSATAKKILYNSINDKSKITKSYLAVCENYHSVAIPSFVKGWITKNEAKQKMDFSLQEPANNLNVKNCAMEVQKLLPSNEKKNGRTSFQLYRIVLETGRKHQIRAIFSFFRTPIVGDKKYGSKIELKNKIFLFAYQLEFNDLPPPLTYLNKKIFTINGLKTQQDITNYVYKKLGIKIS